MSPVTPVAAARSLANPPVPGDQIHPSLAGLQFTPRAANAIKDLFVTKMQSECFWTVCAHSRNEVRSQFVGLLRMVDSRVQPHIEGVDGEVIPLAAVRATEKLVSLVAKQNQSYTHDQVVAAGGLLLHRYVDLAVQLKAEEAFLTAACSYFAEIGAEYKESFVPMEWPVEPLSVREYGYLRYVVRMAW